MSIVFYAPRESKCGVCFTNYSLDYLRKHPDLVFVFGDNLSRIGSGGQAIIRDEPNTFGLVTKRNPDHKPGSYMTGTPEDYEAVASDLDRLHQLISTGTSIVFPSSGLGTGLARLQTTAPDLLAYIDAEVSKLIHTDYRLIRTNQR